MKTAILTVGTEILFGQIVNTNTVYLSRELNSLGFDVMYHHTVGDNAARLLDLMNECFKDCDIIITTGGLGPTEDDLTKETISLCLHDTLEMNEECKEVLEKHFANRGRKMTENNYKQAMMPTRGTVLDNPEGTAPGFILTEEREGFLKTVISMPGPPREMYAMWERHVKPYLMSLQDGIISYKLIRTFGIGESSLETVLFPLIDNQTDPTLATYAKDGECSLRVASKRDTKEEADAAVDDMIEKIKAIVGEYIYSTDDEDMYQVVGKLLVENNISISSSESCTGGLFAANMIKVPGISAVFDRGIVSYSNEAKIDELGVKKETIEKYSAESKEVAYEMAKGLYEKTGSKICISSTGVAGPGEYNGIPAGVIFIGLSVNGETKVIDINTKRDNREWNRNYAVLVMLNEIRKVLLGC